LKNYRRFIDFPAIKRGTPVKSVHVAGFSFGLPRMKLKLNKRLIFIELKVKMKLKAVQIKDS
jgi:hypothetical protein